MLRGFINKGPSCLMPYISLMWVLTNYALFSLFINGFWQMKAQNDRMNELNQKIKSKLKSDYNQSA